ncbi:hypothetical protein BDW67DRAFT_158483 [Aspergillus spinulosporus]
MLNTMLCLITIDLGVSLHFIVLLLADTWVLKLRRRMLKCHYRQKGFPRFSSCPDGLQVTFLGPF